jgi:hypothetical protein
MLEPFLDFNAGDLPVAKIIAPRLDKARQNFARNCPSKPLRLAGRSEAERTRYSTGIRRTLSRARNYGTAVFGW